MVLFSSAIAASVFCDPDPVVMPGSVFTPKPEDCAVPALLVPGAGGVESRVELPAPDGTPLIEGLEDGVAPPTRAEQELLRQIPLDRSAIDKELGVPLPADFLERLMFRSTLTIRGLKSGFTGKDGTEPHRARGRWTRGFTCGGTSRAE